MGRSDLQPGRRAHTAAANAANDLSDQREEYLRRAVIIRGIA
jgi:hypothetical protein